MERLGTICEIPGNWHKNESPGANVIYSSGHIPLQSFHHKQELNDVIFENLNVWSDW